VIEDLFPVVRLFLALEVHCVLMEQEPKLELEEQWVCYLLEKDRHLLNAFFYFDKVSCTSVMKATNGARNITSDK
jgi:hypothetical protein